MTAPVFVAVPTRYWFNSALILEKAMNEQGAEHVAMIDNADMAPRSGDHAIIPMVGRSLGEMWNRAWADARLALRNDDGTVRPGFLALLNDDIHVPPHFLFWLRTAIEARGEKCWVISPDPALDKAQDIPQFARWEIEPVIGVGRPRPDLPNGGITGWAFMVRTDAPLFPLVDPKLRWFYTDNDIVRTVYEKGGECCVVKGLGVKHDLSQTLGHRLPELQPEIDADEAYYKAKWGALCP